MKIGASVSTDIAKYMRGEIAAAEKATTVAMAIAGKDLKTRLRQQVVSAGLGVRLSNTIRSQTYPTSGESLRAASLVWTKAPVIFESHMKGSTIRSKNGVLIAIPLPAAGRGFQNRRLTPKEWEKRRGLKLKVLPRKGKNSLLVADARINTRGLAVISRSKTGKNRALRPIFVLVPQLKLRKRLDFEKAADRVAGRVAGLIVSNWAEAKIK